MTYNPSSTSSPSRSPGCLKKPSTPEAPLPYARGGALMFRSAVGAIAHELPGVGLHLWGVKLSTFKEPIALHEQVISFDSAAWNGLFGADREEWRVNYPPAKTGGLVSGATPAEVDASETIGRLTAACRMFSAAL